MEPGGASPVRHGGQGGVWEVAMEGGSRPLDPSPRVPNNFYLLFIFL
jgi:hypothetical protein